MAGGDDDWDDWDGWGEGWAAEDEAQVPADPAPPADEPVEGELVDDRPFEDPVYEDEPPPPDRPRRGREWLIALVVVLVAIGVVGALVATSGDDGGRASDDLETARTTTSLRATTTSSTQLGVPGDPTSTSSTSPGSSSTVTTVAGTPGGTPTTKKPTTSSTTAEDTDQLQCSATVVSPAANTAPGWQPSQANKPMRVSFCVSDKEPKVGQPIEITVHALDSDAAISSDDCGVHIGFDTNLSRDCRTAPDGAIRQLPNSHGGDQTLKVTHAFTTAGAHTIGFSSTSHGGADPSDPLPDNYGFASAYASFAAVTLGITVHA